MGAMRNKTFNGAFAINGTNGAFVIKGTNTILRDAQGENVRESTHAHAIKHVGKSLYHYQQSDGNVIEVLKYSTAKNQRYEQRNQLKKKVINPATGKFLVDSKNQEVLYGDMRITGNKYHYFFTDYNSTEKIPVKRLYAFKQEKARRRRKEAPPINATTDEIFNQLIANYNNQINSTSHSLPILDAEVLSYTPYQPRIPEVERVVPENQTNQNLPSSNSGLTSNKVGTSPHEASPLLVLANDTATVEHDNAQSKSKIAISQLIDPASNSNLLSDDHSFKTNGWKFFEKKPTTAKSIVEKDQNSYSNKNP